MGKRGVDGAPSQISDNYFACPKFRRALRGIASKLCPAILGQFWKAAKFTGRGHNSSPAAVFGENIAKD
jgi:hypothetical protein